MYWSVKCWKINQNYINWKATVNKTEKNISPRFFYQSKYSSRVWNMIQNKDLVICGIGLCRGVRIYCRFFCGDGAEQWKKDPCWAQLGSITHLTLQCSAWLLVTALSTQQSSGLLPWAPMSALQITAAFPLAEKQKASTQKAQRHLHSLCFERNVPCFSVLWRKSLENLCLSRNGLATGLIA